MEDFSCEDVIVNESKCMYDEPINIARLGLHQEIYPIHALERTINVLNKARDLYFKTLDDIYVVQIMRLLPASYNMRKRVIIDLTINYHWYRREVEFKLKEWTDFFNWVGRIKDDIKSNIYFKVVPDDSLDKFRNELEKTNSNLMSGVEKSVHEAMGGIFK
jgi:hypothetical protein